MTHFLVSIEGDIAARWCLCTDMARNGRWRVAEQGPTVTATHLRIQPVDATQLEAA